MNAPTLLLVEDEPLIALAAQDSLEDRGFAVLLAGDGAEAHSLLEREIDGIAGLVTDIRLGFGPDGWALARHARELDPDLPVVYMTGDSAHQWTEEGVPGSILVQKPYAAAQLLDAIASLLPAEARTPA